MIAYVTRLRLPSSTSEIYDVFTHATFPHTIIPGVSIGEGSLGSSLALEILSAKLSEQQFLRINRWINLYLPMQFYKETKRKKCGKLPKLSQMATSIQTDRQTDKPNIILTFTTHYSTHNTNKCHLKDISTYVVASLCYLYHIYHFYVVIFFLILATVSSFVWRMRCSYRISYMNAVIMHILYFCKQVKHRFYCCIILSVAEVRKEHWITDVRWRWGW